MELSGKQLQRDICLAEDLLGALQACFSTIQADFPSLLLVLDVSDPEFCNKDATSAC